MKAASFMKNGGPEVMQYGEVPDPVAGPGQVLVDVHAASVHGADWKVRSGHYAPITTFPYIPGRDFSGVVGALGAGVNDLSVGDAVFGDVPLHTVMGGFHLSGQQIEEIIPDTVNDMKGFGLRRIVPAHCTGWRAVGALVRTFGEECVVPSAVGRQFVF